MNKKTGYFMNQRKQFLLGCFGIFCVLYCIFFDIELMVEAGIQNAIQQESKEKISKETNPLKQQESKENINKETNPLKQQEGKENINKETNPLKQQESKENISKETNPMKQQESKYITREEFVQFLLQEMSYSVVEKNSKQPYWDAAMRLGILTVQMYDMKAEEILTKSDAAVLLVNAEELLHGVTISEELVDIIVAKRISDIGKESKGRQRYLAKAYALGFIKGNSNGSYSTNRSLKPWQKITRKDAAALAQMLFHKEKRSVIALDGQLIRRTKLPKNADKFPYILASYPNEYYDWEFKFMKQMVYTKDEKNEEHYYYVKNFLRESTQAKRRETWAYPIDMDSLDDENTFYVDGNFVGKTRYPLTIQGAVDAGKKQWEEKVRRYLLAIFNVNYHTIGKDKKWYNTILSLDEEYQNDLSQPFVEQRISDYIKAVQKNHTIIECDKVGVDMSTLYYDNGFMLRCYVHYRIVSADKIKTDIYEISPLTYTRFTPDFHRVKLGEWRDGYYDIRVGISYGNYNIYYFDISDYHYYNRVITNEELKGLKR